MAPGKGHTGMARLSTWVSRDRWAERIITFNSAWFTVSMGTGIMVQVLENFPYGAQWLRNLAYCFWVLDILLFVFFSMLGIIRSIRYPDLTKATFQDFYQTSYLGAIPVTVDTISVGILKFYSDRMGAVWAAYALYWAAVAMSLIVGGIVVFITCAFQEAPELTSVTGVYVSTQGSAAVAMLACSEQLTRKYRWLLTFIPFIVTAATGSVIIPYLPLEFRGFTLVVTFLIWALGMTMSMVILVYYFWRLVRHKLPMRDFIVSCFIPVGPPGLGAYGIHNLSLDLSAYILDRDFALLPAQTSALPPAAQPTATLAVAGALHWLGILTSLFFVALSTFWLLQCTLAVLTRPPRRFTLGFWGLVFPCGVYVNATSLLAADLDNHGLRGWSAAMAVVTALLWCFCAAGTLRKGVWRAELFFAPGREGCTVRRALGIDGDDGADSEGYCPEAAKARGAGCAGVRVGMFDEEHGAAKESADGWTSGSSEAAGSGDVVAEWTMRRPDGTYVSSRPMRLELIAGFAGEPL